MNDPHEQVYPYVVAALPRDEAEEFEAHLGQCDKCRGEVAELREVTSQLAESVATEPPAGLRGAVMAAVAATPQGHSGSSPSPSRGGSNGAPPSQRRASTIERPDATVVPLHRSQPSRLPALLAAAAVLAALALGGWGFLGWQDAQQTAEQATAETEQLTELLGASDVSVVSGRVTTTGGTGTVVMSSSRKQAVFVSTELRELPQGKVYEAWTIDREPVPAGTFSAEDARASVSLPPAVVDAQSVAITVEPAGGSQAPTSDAIFTVSLPQR